MTERRVKLITLVHTGRKHLGLDDDCYRDLLAAKSQGKRSAKDLTTPELEAVVKHMRHVGFIPVKPRRAAPKEERQLDMRAEASKARALWLWLHEIGIVRDPSERALAAFARRTCGGVDALQWTHRLDNLIEGIKVWGARELRPRIEQRINALRAANRLPAHATVEWVALSVCPTLDPKSFAALQRTWAYLDERQGDVA